MGWLKRHFFSIDPRTLGLTRILLGLLLLFDLGKRSLELENFYTNAGLIPNHTVLWRPIREWMLSAHLSLSHGTEVWAVFVVTAGVYLCFLAGFKTRLSHVLSLFLLISAQTRIDFVSNGGDFVFCDIMLWTAFLPMGRRFSVDSVLAALRSRPPPGAEELAEEPPARDTEPVVSVAVLAVLLQLSVIYFFNTVHKNGETWRQGTAVYYLLQQERVVTPLGFWVREHLPIQFSYLTSYGTLVIEGMAPLLILSPFGKPWTRRLAIILLWGLHGSILLLADVGLFSPVMMVFVTLLATPADWDLIERLGHRRKRLHRRVCFDAGSEGSRRVVELFRRLDWLGRIEAVASTEPGALPAEGKDLEAEILVTVDPRTGRHWIRSRAIGQALRALPLGALYAWPLLVFPGVFDRLYERMARAPAFSARSTGEESGAEGPRPARGPLFPGLRPRLREAGGLLREQVVLILLVVAGSQIIVENAAIPDFMKVRQPRWMAAAVAYLRLNQGWSMFAPDAPRTDLWMVVDATTKDGRHIDPYNELAARVADPGVRYIPKRLDTKVYYRKYSERIPGRGVWHGPFADWIFSHDQRMGRPEDYIVAFDVYLIEDDSPPPGEDQPSNERVQKVLSRRRGRR